MSVTVAFAADMASSALTLTFDVGCDPPLGSKTRTTASQNAIRRRNRMTLPLKSPRLFFAALRLTVAARPETAVRPAVRFLPIFDANQARVFRKFEQSGFDSNLQQLHQSPDPPAEPRARADRRARQAPPAFPATATDRSPFRTNTPAGLAP